MKTIDRYEGINLESLTRLNKDLRNACQTFSPQEARYLVDAYYSIQEYRKASANQVRALDETEEPHAVIGWLFDQTRMLENQVKAALVRYTDVIPIGIWCKQNIGIGPVIAAGLISHIDIHKAPTAGHIWSFAGITGNPDIKWEKGKKRPWNADLKVLCWKIGQSFVKVSGNPDSVYGRIYRERKAFEIPLNEGKKFADQAKRKLETNKIGKDTVAYSFYIQGMLPPAHIDQRAQRYATKMFLAHLHEKWYEMEFGEAPIPFAIAHLDHVHRIEREVQ